MNAKNKFVMVAAAAMLAGAASSANAVEPKKTPDKEKCYGIAKGGKNDCSWAGGACHGSAPKDREPTAWILMPKGLCEKIAGSSLTLPVAAPKK